MSNTVGDLPNILVSLQNAINSKDQSIKELEQQRDTINQSIESQYHELNMLRESANLIQVTITSITGTPHELNPQT